MFRIVPEVDLMPWLFTGGGYTLHEAFDSGRVIETTHTVPVTHMIMVPSQLAAVLNRPAFAPEKLGSLEMLQNIGARCPGQESPRTDLYDPPTRGQLETSQEAILQTVVAPAGFELSFWPW